MSDLTKALGPVSASERIAALDVLRGVALLGILLMNIAGFGLVFMAYGDPTVQGGADGLNLLVWKINNLFFEGTMRALFSMLFGVGMVLMTSRMINRGGGLEVADIYYRRTIWLLIFGVIHAYLILWPGEILFSYGLYGLFLFPFRNAPAKKLIIGVVVLIMFGFGLQYYQYSSNMDSYEKYQLAQTYEEGAELPDEVKAGKETWEGMMAEMKPDDKSIHKNTESMHKGYLDLVLFLAPINRMVQTSFNYDYNPWDVLPMMLLGIALFKLQVITASLRRRDYLLMMILGYGIGVSINYYETSILINDNFSVLAFMKSGLTYPFGRVAVAFGHIGLIMLFCKSGILGFLRNALAAVGRMALTNYIMHSVICAFVFTGIGFSLFGQLERYELYYVVGGIWLFQLIVSPIWLKYFRFGPLEWLWRSLTYRERQPFKRISH
ncbi:DUF418 domain-containing protein [Lentiprolixibacter aurantiacus]|uniref:DUF418 domain-containing protein n=1 Tax=Lentiprolixibacter aurantiacus TaxID=2993939 RepID=A0AAE3MII7_9FLAO|nr:DUF418 domain-containing protein [Lentiprolixibacter aurantiacus]MCX2718435.1 DUF418 domain-containing protein [Lentiprolixibacter aurantiacus]